MNLLGKSKSAPVKKHAPWHDGDQSIEPVGSTPVQFGEVIRQEIDKYTKLAKEIGARIDWTLQRLKR